MKMSKRLKKMAKTNGRDLMKKANVIGVGAGEEWKNGVPTGREALLVLVKKKLPKDELTEDDLVPSNVYIDGFQVPTDVIEVGEIKALSTEHRGTHRPLVAGISVGHPSITAGTLGAFVVKNGKILMLSNNHIFANSNKARIGDPIYQPGPTDGGRSSSTVGNLVDFVPIVFSLTDYNKVDAALASIKGVTDPTPPAPPTDPTYPTPSKRNFLQKIWDAIVGFFRKSFGGKSSVQNVNVNVNGGTVIVTDDTPAVPQVSIANTVLNLGVPTGQVAAVEPAQVVQKSGRTTGYTTSTVIATDVAVSVDFGSQGLAMFEDQILVRDFSRGGDSGSAVYDMDNNLVGLLFAGSNTVTMLNKIENVFTSLKIDRPL